MFRSVLQICRFLSVKVKSVEFCVETRVPCVAGLSYWATGVRQKLHRDSKKASLAS